MSSTAISPAQRPESVALSVTGIRKSYGATAVLSDVTMTLARGEVVSVVGENGAGKSTLMNVFSGITAADEGLLARRGAAYRPKNYLEAKRYGVTRVFQEQSLVADVPVYENVLLGHEAQFTRCGVMQRRRMIEVAQRIVDEAEVAVDVCARTGDLSFSARQSVEIARACLAPVHLLGIEDAVVLLDEPTSALDRKDEEAFFRLVQRMRKSASLLFVSHRLTEVLELSDTIYVLKDGHTVARLDAKSTSEAQLHALMVGRERASDFYCQQLRRPVASSISPVVAVRGLSHPGEYQGIDLEVRPGEVLGIGGLLDSGKSALAKGVAGVVEPHSGTVRLAPGNAATPNIRRAVRQGLGYVPAERLIEGIIPSFPVSWNVSLASGGDLMASRFGLWHKSREAALANEYIQKLRIRCLNRSQPCERLSGGNQQKVVLARWLARKPKVLILDNPTRGVDAGAKEEIYLLIRQLANQGVGILLVTDELLELIGLSNRILIMSKGQIVMQRLVSNSDEPTERELVAAMLTQQTDKFVESTT